MKAKREAIIHSYLAKNAQEYFQRYVLYICLCRSNLLLKKRENKFLASFCVYFSKKHFLFFTVIESYKIKRKLAFYICTYIVDEDPIPHLFL